MALATNRRPKLGRPSICTNIPEYTTYHPPSQTWSLGPHAMRVVGNMLEPWVAEDTEPMSATVVVSGGNGGSRDSILISCPSLQGCCFRKSTAIGIHQILGSIPQASNWLSVTNLGRVKPWPSVARCQGLAAGRFDRVRGAGVHCTDHPRPVEFGLELVLWVAAT